MTIHIESLAFEAIIGLLPHERITKQRVVVDIEIEYSYVEGLFINYAEVASSVETHLVSSEYELLEDALYGLQEMILSHYHTITRLSIKISKPDIMPNCIVALSDSWIV